MREIRFRGKRVDNGEWAYGYLFVDQNGAAFILDTNNDGDEGKKCRFIFVSRKTVGQFTGEHEHLGHKGREIYEGDIVEINTLGINYCDKKINGVVEYQDGCFTVEFSEPVYDITDHCYRQRLYVKCFVVNHAIKVIGNIHEKLELLKCPSA